jgi:Zn-dependent protease
VPDFLPAENSSNCKRCAAPLAAEALVCNRCHTLVHAEALEQLSSGAQMLEEQGDRKLAKEQWLTAAALLPANSRQLTWIQDHVRHLELASSDSSSPEPTSNKWVGRLGPLAPLALALAKGKALLALLNLKFMLSLVAFAGLYWGLYGLSFGLGFAVQILLHEFGHYIDIKRRGLPADMPVFLPGIGAYVRWQALGVPVETRAAVSLAGPLAGCIAAAGCLLVWFQTGAGVWGALARTGAWINLLNLIPVWGLDGGHAFLALTRRHRILVLTVTLAALILTRESIFVLILIGIGWRLFTKDLPKESSPATAAYFVGVLSALASLLWILSRNGFTS